MADVFLSYKSEDRPKARLIAGELEREGFSVWWDPALRTGETYDEVIERNLRESAIVVVLWSEISTKSKWVRAEATIGDDKGALAPARIDACDLPVAFRLTQTADLSQWTGDRADRRWREFVDDLTAKRAERQSQVNAGVAPRPPDKRTIETVFWDSIRDSTEPADFDSYLKRYPNGHFTEIATNRLANLRLAAPHMRTQRRGVSPYVIVSFLMLAAIGAAVIGANYFRDPPAILARFLSPVAGIGASGGEEREIWEIAQRSNQRADYEGYVATYPNGRFTRLAQARLRQAERAAGQQAWEQARSANTEQAYQTFLQDFADGANAGHARAALVTLAEEREASAWTQIAQSTTLTDFERFIADYPDGAHAAEAQAKIDTLRAAAAASDRAAYEQSVRQRSSASYRAYLAAHPNGAFVQNVNARLASCSVTMREARGQHERYEVSAFGASTDGEADARAECLHKLRMGECPGQLSNIVYLGTRGSGAYRSLRCRATCSHTPVETVREETCN